MVNGKPEDVSCAILFAALDLIDKCANAVKGSFVVSAEAELFYEISASILCLPKKRLPKALQQKVAATASLIADICPAKK
eukprot:scaffold5005_cov58-Cylindrotheca_fusiformis.AAC.1